ncbi:MAG: hypothetical protein AAF065_12835 [Verrucomicrobiota bacterium]
MRRKEARKADLSSKAQGKKPASMWRRTAAQNLFQNTTSGIFNARYRALGKIRWQSLRTKSLKVAHSKLRVVLASADSVRQSRANMEGGNA